MADRNQTRPRRWYLVGAGALSLLCLLLITGVTYASPGLLGGQMLGIGIQVIGTPTITSTPTQVCIPIWEQLPSPSPGDYSNVLNAVAAISANNVWAVGYFTDDSTNVQQTLTAHWDGTGWTQVPSPNAGAAANLLLGVSAASADDVWAVGWYRGEVPNE